MLDALKSLLQSRKFLLMLADTLVSFVLFVVANYYPNAESQVKQLIVIVQPVIVAVIVGISLEDMALKHNPKFLDLDK